MMISTTFRKIIFPVTFEENCILLRNETVFLNVWAMKPSLGLIFHNDEFNPLTHMGDQDRISPYNINSISNRQVMRIKKNINLGIIS